MRTQASVVKELECSKIRSYLEASPAFMKVWFPFSWAGYNSLETCAQCQTSHFKKVIGKSKNILKREAKAVEGLKTTLT